jgi:Domain of unknown function (DUF5658)
MLTTTLFSVAVTVGSFNGSLAIVPAASPMLPRVEAQLPRSSPRRDLSALTAAKRPPSLVPLYGSLIALQGADVYFTATALAKGAHEANPIVQPLARKTAIAAAVKVGTTAAAIYFVERAWKQNRKGAVILAAALNAATGAVVVHNARR